MILLNNSGSLTSSLGNALHNLTPFENQLGKISLLL